MAVMTMMVMVRMMTVMVVISDTGGFRYYGDVDDGDDSGVR